jgi:uncharacterized membrane protein YkoI
MERQWKTWLGIAVLGASALAGATVAAAAGSSSKTSTTTTATTTATTTTRTGHTPETPLTGDVAAKAKAAAIAKVGGTAERATTETDSSNADAAYEVYVTKTDGTHVEVILDKDYNVLAVETGHGRGPHGFGHGRGRNGEAELTGDVAAKAKAAAVAKVGGTAERASTETDSSNADAAYEVHVTKSDGTHVEVILDKDYNLLAVETHDGHPKVSDTS